MRFKLISNENRETLAPLCCKRPLADIRLAGTTFADLLKERWSLSDCGSISISSKFWPSLKFVKQLKGKPFIVTDEAGNTLAETAGSGEKTSYNLAETGFVVEHPWQVLEINEELLTAIRKSDIRGTVREGAVVDGILCLGEGSVILPGVYIEGIAVIGKNCKIGPNAYLRGCTSIGDDCHIGNACEVKNSIFQDKVAAGHLSYIGDTIVGCHVNFGAGTITSNFRHDGKNHRSMIAGSLVDTGRRKFGSIIGDNVHTGIHTSIYPGRKIWADIDLRPAAVVKYDIMNQPL